MEYKKENTVSLNPRRKKNHKLESHPWCLKRAISERTRQTWEKQNRQTTETEQKNTLPTHVGDKHIYCLGKGRTTFLRDRETLDFTLVKILVCLVLAKK